MGTVVVGVSCKLIVDSTLDLTVDWWKEKRSSRSTYVLFEVRMCRELFVCSKVMSYEYTGMYTCIISSWVMVHCSGPRPRAAGFLI